MNEPTLCAICDSPVPPDAPVNICLSHLREAYLYIRDALAKRSPSPVHMDQCRQPEPTMVYYLLFGDRIKIGTTWSLRDRLQAIPHDELLAAEPGGYELEQERHRQFRAHRIFRNREWFRDCPEIREHVDALRRQHGLIAPDPQGTETDGGAPDLSLMKLLTGAQAARYAGVSRQAIVNWRNRNHLPVAVLDSRGRPLYRLRDVAEAEAREK